LPTVTFDLSDVENEKLAQLAAARGKSAEACVKDFIASCQPGGSGWKNPEETGAKSRETTNPTSPQKDPEKS